MAQLIPGHAFGESSPATMPSETFYLDVILDPGAQFPLPNDHEDRGLYIT
jgi:redox-sensitive bicupin YhaK (pirin superfamily)